MSDEGATLTFVDALTNRDDPHDRPKFSGVARGWRLVRGSDSGDPVALSRLDALLVEAQRIAPDDPEVMRLRLAYAVRQWGQQRGTVILRSNTQLLEDLAHAQGPMPEETAVITLLARVELFCDDPDGHDRTVTLDELGVAASDLISHTGDQGDAAATARSFTRLIASVRDGHRTLNDAVKLARVRAMPEVMVRCLAYASWQSRLAQLASEWTRADE